MSNSKKFKEIALGVFTTGILSGALPTEAGKEIPEKGKLEETKAKTEIPAVQAVKLEKAVKAAAFGGGAATIPLSKIGVFEKEKQSAIESAEEVKKIEEAPGKPASEKKTRILLSLEKFGGIIKTIIEQIAEGETSVDSMNLQKIDNKIQLQLKLKARGFKIGLVGNIVNKNGSIAVEEAEIDAPFLIRGIAKKTFAKYLPDLPEIFTKILAAGSGREVKRLQFDEAGNLAVDFKTDS